MDKSFTYDEIQSKLEISKATLYNRIKKFEKVLEDHTTMIDKKKCIDSFGIEIIKKNSLEYIENLENIENKVQDGLENKERELFEKEIESLKRELFIREEQLDDKDKHLRNLEKELEIKNIQIGNLDERMREAHVLAKDTKDKVLLLEENQKGFWGKLFKS